MMMMQSALSAEVRYKSRPGGERGGTGEADEKDEMPESLEKKTAPAGTVPREGCPAVPMQRLLPCSRSLRLADTAAAGLCDPFVLRRKRETILCQIGVV